MTGFKATWCPPIQIDEGGGDGGDSDAAGNRKRARLGPSCTLSPLIEAVLEQQRVAAVAAHAAKRQHWAALRRARSTVLASGGHSRSV